MKKLLLCITIALIMTACSSNTVPAEGLRHVVSFKFKPDASEEQVKALIQAFEGLQKDIPQIKAFEWGLNNSPEGFDKGMTHIFQLTFENAKARDEYLPHPAHKDFGDTHGGIIEDLVVVDYIIE
ncbi:stress responsive alpha/beta barrel protein [Roseivirga pacifica]|uniref:Stress responsive A/B Barrel Domain n=1 Tax=Roseivirga pacifica TaxID=1267423 RepID=A0A1I0QU87_9BACT|nr:Dabb family protein [Roseivirga pacifica]RKQ42605.1 stress responsive alpha/beta barrel protein [Roseivirga pacifica]SEW30525.1 Stress responsive A/B Barrel Domain [Roseivirga pacifica]